MNLSAYKLCSVPLCRNNTRITPDKLFIHLPKRPGLRKKWLQLARRDLASVSPKTTMYFCEDHFDLENDMENYTKFKIMGSVAKIRMRPHCLPKKFVCQPDRKKRTAGSMPTSLILKRQQAQLVQEALMQNEEAAAPSISETTSSLGAANEIPDSDMPQTLNSKSTQIGPEYDNKLVQVSIRNKFRSKSTQTSSSTAFIATSHKVIKSPLTLIKCDCNKNSTMHIQLDSSPSVKSLRQLKIISDSSNQDAKNDVDLEMSVVRKRNQEEELCQLSLQNTLRLIKKKPRFYIGIPKECYYLVDIIQKHTNIPENDILLCLTKIRLDKTFLELGDAFGILTSYACKLFKKYIPVIAGMLGSFIIRSNKAFVKQKMPMAFRHNYYNIHCIINCLEIEIQKPSDPVYQALTWSDYKKANTIKYLISSTPDGLINYVSPGYTGSVTDVTLVQNCKFLDSLEPGVFILADRGFQHIEQVLLQRGFYLVRPPSLSANSKMTKIGAQMTKKVANIRMHIKRVIRRIRKFLMLSPHSVVKTNLIQCLDECVVIACALINLQGCHSIQELLT